MCHVRLWYLIKKGGTKAMRFPVVIAVAVMGHIPKSEGHINSLVRQVFSVLFAKIRNLTSIEANKLLSRKGKNGARKT